MGKVRKKSKNTFNYNVNRKKLKRRAQKKAAPRITCDEIRNAWNDSKSVAGNLADMGLAADPNKALPIHSNTTKNRNAGQSQVRKPYVIENAAKKRLTVYQRHKATTLTAQELVLHKYKDADEAQQDLAIGKAVCIGAIYTQFGIQMYKGQLKALASLPSKKTMGISSDMILYVRHMVENYGEDYKAMARDDQNYYQDTPKQIQGKINLYKRHHPDEYQALIASRTIQ